MVLFFVKRPNSPTSIKPRSALSNDRLTFDLEIETTQDQPSYFQTKAT